MTRHRFLFQVVQVILHPPSLFRKQLTVAGGVLIYSFNGKPKATVMENTDAYG